MRSSILGFPRMGINRELKKSLESYWSSKITSDELKSAAIKLRSDHWNLQAKQGLDILPSSDFSYYDQVLDHAFLFNAIPKRYQGLPLTPLDVMFAMARGHQKSGVDVPSLEMVKWFDSNYHYMRPEVDETTHFELNSSLSTPVDHFLEAKQSGHHTRPVLLGPVSFLYLSKVTEGSSVASPLDLLSKLLPVYVQLINLLVDAGVDWIQMDEPIVVFDLESSVRNDLKTAYDLISRQTTAKIMLTTYFGEIEPQNLEVIQSLPVAGLHVDVVRLSSSGYLDTVVEAAKSSRKVLSIGIVDGRNIWRCNLKSALQVLNSVVSVLGSQNVIVATSSSLLHTPHTIDSEKKLDPQVKSWFSFATQKIREVSLLCLASNGFMTDGMRQEFELNAAVALDRANSSITVDSDVRKRLASVNSDDLKRPDVFSVRKKLQEEKFKLPLFPTTTIGSFPQTPEIRSARSKFVSGKSSKGEYDSFIRDEIKRVIKIQEEIGLDVLVHGESERNDMVQYFGEKMKGFAFTEFGWVQSYGSRCVRPPIVIGDVSRPYAMTVDESSYAQSITSKPVKGMLTGPVTILRWSFPRDDVSQAQQFLQIALAIRDEVQDLEAAGLNVIQVDEPAIREGLPLRKKDWPSYLESAVTSFKLATSVAKSDTQIHSHFCYSDFNDIFPSIQALDADVISIESSKSDLKLIRAFKSYGYKAWIGPGVYDIHSPRIPSKDEIIQRLSKVVTVLKPELVWINPDCGLKTRGWAETKPSLENLVAAARHFRSIEIKED